jgi:broad specificity phosphatase PhoE
MVQQRLIQTLRLAATPAVILIRHAERGHIDHPATGHNVLLTPKGESDARVLGALFSEYGPTRIFHALSPALPRISTPSPPS